MRSRGAFREAVPADPVGIRLWAIGATVATVVLMVAGALLWARSTTAPPGVSADWIEIPEPMGDVPAIYLAGGVESADGNRESSARILLLTTVSSGAPWCEVARIHRVDVAPRTVVVTITRMQSVMDLRCNDDALIRAAEVLIPGHLLGAGEIELRLVVDGAVQSVTTACLDACGDGGRDG